MKKLFIFIYLCASLTHADVILVLPGGGLTGLASLKIAERLEDTLKNYTDKFLADFIDYGIGVSVGSLVAALLLAQKDGETIFSTKQAREIFESESKIIFSRINKIGERLLKIGVDKKIIDRLVEIFTFTRHDKIFSSVVEIFRNGKIKPKDFAKLILLSPFLIKEINFALSETSQKIRKNNLEKLIVNLIGDQKFIDDDIKKIITVSSYKNESVIIAHEKIYFKNYVNAMKRIPLSLGLLASAAMPLFPKIQLPMRYHKQKRYDFVKDGVLSLNGTLPIQPMIDWRNQKQFKDVDDLIIVLGNGGPIDDNFMHLFASDQNFAQKQKSGAGVMKFILFQPQINDWFTKTLLQNNSTKKEIFRAVDQIDQEIFESAAEQIFEHKK